MIEKTIVGYKEYAKISIGGKIYEFTATMDTGNAGVVPTLGVKHVFVGKNNVQVVINNESYLLESHGEATPIVGNVMHRRPIIKLDFIEIHGKRLENVFCGVTDQRNKSTQMLINRDIMSKMNFVVDPSLENIKIEEA